MSIIRLQDDSQHDEMVWILEDRIEIAHDATCDVDAPDEAKEEAKKSMMFAKRFMRQIDPDNPVLSEHIIAGEQFDWEKFWTDQDEDDEEDEDENDPESLASRLADEVAAEVEAEVRKVENCE